MERRTGLLCVYAAILLFIGGISSSAAQGATLYVSPNGNDSNPGTIDHPVASPQRAVDLSAAGDSIYLRAGTYNLTLTISNWKPNTTMASYPNELAVIVPNNCEAVWIYRADGVTLQQMKFVGRLDQPNMGKVLLVTESNNVTFADLDVSGGNAYCIKWDAYDGDPSTPARNSTGGRVLRCHLHDSGGKSVKLFNADNYLIEDCDIGPSGLNVTVDSGEGIDCIGSQGITVRRCHIHDTAGNGMYYKGSVSGGVVEQCLIENCGIGGILLGQDTDLQFMRDGNSYEARDCVARNNIILNTQGQGIGTYSGSNVRFENNTMINVAQGSNAGFYVVRDSRGVSATQVTFKNNIVVMGKTTRPLAYVIQIADPLVSDNNIWFKSDGSSYLFWRETATSGDYWQTFADWQNNMAVDQHSVTIDPALDSASLYKPLAASPAIDHGATISEVTNDYLGTSRPQGSAYDIGAYEIIAAAPPAPPTVAVSASTTSGAAPLPVTFTSSASAPGGQIVSYSWNFGDGQTSAQPSVAHTYQSAGSFTARLTVTDNHGGSASASVAITATAPATPPQVNIAATPASGMAPLGVQFSSQASAPGSSIASFNWDFGDGQSSSAANPSHMYQSAGAFTATLTVTSAAGASASASTFITAAAAPNPGCMFVPQVGTIYQNSSFASESGSFTVTFDATAGSAATDAAFALSLDAQRSWTGLAAIVRFNDTNTIDARNGNNYTAGSVIGYIPNTGYHVRLVVNVAAHTYTVYVTPPGAAEQLLAQDYSFRTEQQGVASLNNYTAVAQAGSLDVCNFSVGSGGGSPPPQSPTLQLISPNGGETLVARTDFPITWSATGTGIKGFDVSYSVDNGATWQAIATGLPATATTLTWRVPKVKARTARIKVTLRTTNGALVESVSQTNFTIRRF